MAIFPGPTALIRMWSDTRFAVLAAVVAALHAAVLIPLKAIPLLPGVTEVRPAMVLPIVFALLFGPAAAWGAALGNTLGDLFGSLGPGTLFGFLGNLLYGYLPWRVWRAWRGGPVAFSTLSGWALYLFAVITASAVCALVIAWGIDLLGLFPFGATAGVIFLNNLAFGALLGPPLLLALQSRVRRLHLAPQEMEASAAAGTVARWTPRIASLAVAVIALAGIAAGYTVVPTPGAAMAIVTPFVVAAIAASALA